MCRQAAGVARRLRDHDTVFALAIGNEIPADTLRWVGEARAVATLTAMIDAVHAEDPDRLVTYGNYPTTEVLLAAPVDFVTMNIYLDDSRQLTRYLARLHDLSGDRPVLLGEIGAHVGSTPDAEDIHAAWLDTQLDAACRAATAGTVVFTWTDDWHVGGRAVEGWRFGLTDRERRPRAALGVASKWNDRDVRDLVVEPPGISVVICAHDAGATIDECLAVTCALDYPDLEVIVVDDGSHDRTAELAARHATRGARITTTPHRGLGAARRVGAAEARHDIVAYLDADAYPSDWWPWFLALAFADHDVVGGPNPADASEWKSRSGFVLATIGSVGSVRGLGHARPSPRPRTPPAQRSVDRASTHPPSRRTRAHRHRRDGLPAGRMTTAARRSAPPPSSAFLRSRPFILDARTRGPRGQRQPR
jgi:hypothetical protein